MSRGALFCIAALMLAACHPGSRGGVPGDSNDHAPFSVIAANDTIRFAGTEPFWGGQSQGDTLVYTTPENPDGRRITVSRFAGRAGLSLSGKLDGLTFDLMITQGDCSDGMSDRTYPFVATLKIGEETRQGCAWTGERPGSASGS